MEFKINAYIYTTLSYKWSCIC